MTAQALVLDFGGVISRMLFETHPLTEQALGLALGTLTWRGPFDPSTDPLWHDMQADKLSERDYWMARTREVGRLVGEEWDSMETFVQRARGADVEAVIRPEAIEAIHAAKAAGKRLAILSNELDLFYGADFRRRLPPGECVFVDDQKRNADGGVRAGMQVVHFDVLQPATSFAMARRLLGISR